MEVQAVPVQDSVGGGGQVFLRMSCAHSQAISSVNGVGRPLMDKEQVNIYMLSMGKSSLQNRIVVER